MSSSETTIAVAVTETHTRVAVIIGQEPIAYRPHDALTISAHILDSIAGCDDNEQTPLTFGTLPRVGVTSSDARRIAIAIALAADQLLDEADLEF